METQEAVLTPTIEAVELQAQKVLELAERTMRYAEYLKELLDKLVAQEQEQG